MRTKFLEFGPVCDVYIHKIKGGPKSFAFITYETEAAAKAYVYTYTFRNRIKTSSAAM